MRDKKTLRKSVKCSRSGVCVCVCSDGDGRVVDGMKELSDSSRAEIPIHTTSEFTVGHTLKKSVVQAAY